MVNYWKLLMGVFFCLLHFSITLQLVSRNYLDMKIFTHIYFLLSVSCREFVCLCLLMEKLNDVKDDRMIGFCGVYNT